MSLKKTEVFDWISQIYLPIIFVQTNGIFLEIGGNDGVFLSNTLLLERMYNWTGILVEASPRYYVPLKEKNRKIWIATLCTSRTSYPNVVSWTNFRVQTMEERESEGMTSIPTDVIGIRDRIKIN